MPDQPLPADLTLGEVWRGQNRVSLEVREMRSELNGRLDSISAQIATQSAMYVSQVEYRAHRSDDDRRISSMEDKMTWFARFLAGAVVMAIICPLVVYWVTASPR